VVAEPAKKDVGLVKPGELVTAVFTLLNPLDHAVTIEQAATSCQCTGVDILGKSIPARGTLEMPVSMKMSKAPIRKMASVTMVIDLGDGQKQPLKVEIEAEVTLAIRAVPGFIDTQPGLVDRKSPERMSGTFNIVAGDGKPFSVVAVQGIPPVFEGFDPAKDQPASKYSLRYDFTKPGTVVPKYLIIETDRSDCPLLDLRVRHDTTKIKPPFKVDAFRSTFGKLAVGNAGTFELELEDVGTKRVTGVRSLSPLIEVAIADQKVDGRNLLLTCSVKPGTDTKGLVFVPVEIKLGDVPYEHLVYGVVR